MKTCDLHTHTIASDGSDTPKELVAKAKQVGLSAIAITDHDTVDGLSEGLKAAAEIGMELIPGIELSVNFFFGNMHILGYYIDFESELLKSLLSRVQKARAKRNPQIIDKLNELGIKVSMAELEDMAQGGQIGRPHIARLLAEKGYVASIQDAFELYLKKGAKAYVPKSVLTPEEAIDGIKRVGGIPILAHPFSLGISNLKKLKEEIIKLKEQGIMGLECYYSEHSENFTKYCLDVAKELGLLVTGGSDYHGKAKPQISLGSGKGSLVIPYSCVKALKKAKYHEV